MLSTKLDRAAKTEEIEITPEEMVEAAFGEFRAWEKKYYDLDEAWYVLDDYQRELVRAILAQGIRAKTLAS